MVEVERREYVAQMEDLKRRLDSLRSLFALWDVSLGAVPMSVVTESIYLQFRKVLERIAMASLLANRGAMESVDRSRRKLGKMWNGDTILKTIEGVNPEFYPIPIVETPSPLPRVKTQLTAREDGFLSRQQYKMLYDQCGSIMHADNPLGKSADYEQLVRDGPMWKERIMQLLNCHRIGLVNEDGFYLVHMHEDRDGRPHIYKFVGLKR